MCHEDKIVCVCVKNKATPEVPSSFCHSQFITKLAIYSEENVLKMYPKMLLHSYSLQVCTQFLQTNYFRFVLQIFLQNCIFWVWFTWWFFCFRALLLFTVVHHLVHSLDLIQTCSLSVHRKTNRRKVLI